MCSYPRQSGWRRRRYLFIGFYFFLIFLVAGVVQLLWNGLLPEILQVKAISYWQALGLLLLCRILFGSFHYGARMGRPSYGGYRNMREKWMHMSEEERAVFKAEWKKRCEKRKPDQ